MKFALYGAWAGWVAVRLVAAAGWIRFPPMTPVEGIRSHAIRVGYPKQQDLFWYAVTVLAGIAGAWVASAVARRLARRAPGRARPWAPAAGVAALGAASVLVLSHGYAASASAWVLAIAGALLPWRDGRWARDGAGPAGRPGEVRTPFRVFSVPMLLSLLLPALAVDPCLRYRAIDGLHEGGMLVYAVHAAHGELPGLDYRPEYGPLFMRTFTGWMTATGMTIAGERRYFALAQWLGTAAHLAVILLVCRSTIARLAGGWLVLTVTTTPFVQYGWANGLRTALPLLGFALAWRAASSRGLAAAGAMAAVGWWYSQEFGTAGLAAGLLVVCLRNDLARRARLGWAAGAALTGGLVIPALLYGGRWTEAFAAPPGGGLLMAKLAGAAALPFPPFLGWDADPARLRAYWWNDIQNLELWLPALLAGPAAAAILAGGGIRRGRGPLLAGLTGLALLFQVPAVVRPLDQVRMGITGAIVLGAVLADPLAAVRPWASRVLLAAVFGFGALHLYAIGESYRDRVRCLVSPAPYPAVRLGRLGEVWLAPDEERRVTALVEAVQRLCPPGGRVYAGAGYEAQVLFLADRMGVSPYPVPFVAQTAARRAEVVASLDRFRPAVALIQRGGIDLPWEEDRREEWDWIRARYRKHSQFGAVEVWVPR